MNASSEFELAQKRLKERQQTRNFLILWGASFCVAVALHLIFPASGLFWLFLEILTALLAGSKALQLYSISPKAAPRTELTEQEMNWLFGADWRDVTGGQEYVFAQERIRKRRLDRIGFIGHLVVFLLISMVMFFSGSVFWGQYHEPFGQLCLVIPLAWFAIGILPDLLRGFPTRGMLERREHRVGEALQRELQRMQPEKLKNDDKPKREVQYTVGDDGELVEIDLPDDEKLKRDGA